MLDLEMIDNTIKELENDDTNFVNCQKLASLYIVRQYYEPPKDLNSTAVEQELNDILPKYRQYCEVKKRYQLNQATNQQVIDVLKDLCREIQEFYHTLYSGTDMPEERDELLNLVKSL